MRLCVCGVWEREKKAMAFLFALVPWVGIPIEYLFVDKEQDILE